MASQKRKRQSTRITSNKRPKYDSSSGDEGGFWEADCILAERRTRNRIEYRIKWKGVDPVTGQDWTPSWEPASNVNEALLTEWLEDKAIPKASESAYGNNAPESSRVPRKPASPARPRPRRRPARKPRVIDSSPEPESSPIAATTTPSIHTGHSSGAEPQSSANTTQIGATEPRTRTSPLVYIEPQINSATRRGYERYSQILQSQAVASQPALDQTQQTDLDSSQLFAAANDFSSGIVLDSQSSAGEASYVFTTQASASVRTTQHTNSSPEEVTEDSGLLEIIQAASRAVSPAPSIPETVDETVQDSQSQTQRLDLQEQTEIPDTFEQVESSVPSTQTIAQRDQGPQEQSAAVQHDSTEVSQETSPEDRTQKETLQQEPVQEQLLGESLQRDTQETAAQQEAAEQTSVVTDVVLQESTQQETSRQETPRQEEEPQQAAERTSSQATTQAEETESSQQGRSQQKTAQQEATQQDTFHHEDTQTNPQETIRDQTAQQDTVQQQTVQSDLAEDTPQPAQNIHQQTFIDSENQDTAPLSASTQSLDVAFLEQSTSAIANLPTEPSIDITHVVNTVEGPPEAPEHPGDTGESDTFAQVPAQPTREQVRAQTPNNTASLVRYDTSYIIEHRNSTDISQPLYRLGQLLASREQNAQLVTSSARLSTQEGTSESIRLTIEVDPTSAQTSPGSRHDSSQETPERRLRSVDSSSSPIALPPTHSFGTGTLSQHVPSRPLTPCDTSSLRTMTDTNDTEKRVRERLDEMKAEQLAKNPFTPRFQRKPRSTLTPSAPASETSANNSPVQPRRSNAIPAVNIALDGTRSPSTVPDRSPAPQAPTSLRTVAFANSREQAIGEASKEPKQDAGTGPRPEHAEFVAAVAAAAAASKPTAPSEEPMQIDDEESSDIDDDGSVLNDDLQLENGEYIVPLFIEGRQSDMYSSYIKDNRELLEEFLKDPQNFEPVVEVEAVLSRMRAIETHMDLVYAEAESASRKDIESAARFGIENSAKFKFLHTLFLNLRDEGKHIVLVTEGDNDALFSILETFCKANSFNCNMPTKGVRVSSEYLEGNLLITAFPSTASPIIQAADLIICLDGVQNAAKIRQKNWAVASGPAPIIHLVLPRSVGHIERYMSSALDNRERMNTIIASLAQMRSDIGKPIDEDTPQASAAAKEVAHWIMVGEEDGELSWPLPSIGSVKAVIEFQTQQSPSSSGSSVPERTKRPLDNEDLDQAKRMRFTPQPQVVASSYPNNEDDTTRISNSVPGTAENEVSWLRQQLQKERAARKAEEERFREHQVMWDKQQEEHETLVREHRLLLGKQKDTEEKLKSVTESKETLQERLAVRTTEKQAFETQLKEQQAIGLTSNNDMAVEMTRLKMELAAAQEERQKALKSAQSTEAMLDYIKEQYRTAQEAASLSQTSVNNLTKDNAELSRQASGEVAKLKQIHHDRQFEQLKRQNENQRAEIANLKRFLTQKEEELVRAKSNVGRMGVGTRAQSATPAPKTRSRAASPMRMSNLRNG